MKNRKIVYAICVAFVAIILTGVTMRYTGAWPVPNCAKTDFGWECNQKTQRQLENNKEFCANKGGVFKCYGRCPLDYPRYCYQKYPDAGKLCQNDSDCDGLCLMDKKDLSDCTQIDKFNFECADQKGYCANYQINDCEKPIVLNNNKAEFRLSLCD